MKCRRARPPSPFPLYNPRKPIEGLTSAVELEHGQRGGGGEFRRCQPSGGEIPLWAPSARVTQWSDSPLRLLFIADVRRNKDKAVPECA